MFNRNLSRWAVVSCGLAIVALLAAQPSLSAAPKSDGEKPAATGRSQKKSTAKRRTANKPITSSERAPRMPAHFNKVVNKQQRTEVLALLNDYKPRIAAKRAELKALVDHRDEALFGVLTPEQRQRVEAYRAESNAKRAATLAAGREAKKKAPAVKSKPEKSSK